MKIQTIVFAGEAMLTDLVNWTKTTLTNLVSRIKISSCRFDLSQGEGASLQVKGSEIYRMDLHAVINIYTNIDRDDFSVPMHKINCFVVKENLYTVSVYFRLMVLSCNS